MSVLLWILGIILVIFGFFWILGGSLLYGIIAIVIGLLLMGYLGGGFGYTRRL
jgi:hypothetical protein